MNERYKKMKAQLLEIFLEKLRLKNEVINLQTIIFKNEEKLNEVLAGLENTNKSLRMIKFWNKTTWLDFDYRKI